MINQRTAIKNIENFVEIQENLPIADKVSHSLHRMQKKKPDGTEASQKHLNYWWAKKISEREILEPIQSSNTIVHKKKIIKLPYSLALQIGYKELTAQEFLRLFNPHQPKYRLATATNSHDVYILSKEVSGFQGIDVELPAVQQDIMNGSLTGLGKLLILCLMINEVDLKKGNLGEDDIKRFIKLDGDNCYFYLDANSKMFSARDIANLPFIIDYWAFNWFAVIRAGKKHSSQIQNEMIAKLRGEINQAILEVLLMHDTLIEYFVNFYTEDKTYANQMIKKFIEAKNQLLHAAVKMPKAHNMQSFIEFFSTVNIEATINQLAEQFNNFIGAKKQAVFNGLNVAALMQESYAQALIEIKQFASTNNNNNVNNNNNEIQFASNPSSSDITSATQKTSKKRNSAGYLNQFSLRQIYALSRITTAKTVADELGTNTKTLAKYLKSFGIKEFRQLKKMSEQEFNQNYGHLDQDENKNVSGKKSKHENSHTSFVNSSVNSNTQRNVLPQHNPPSNQNLRLPAQQDNNNNHTVPPTPVPLYNNINNNAMPTETNASGFFLPPLQSQGIQVLGNNNTVNISQFYSHPYAMPMQVNPSTFGNHQQQNFPPRLNIVGNNNALNINYYLDTLNNNNNNNANAASENNNNNKTYTGTNNNLTFFENPTNQEISSTNEQELLEQAKLDILLKNFLQRGNHAK